MFKINLGDVGCGLIMAVTAPLFVAITVLLGAIISAPGFDAWAVDYHALFHNLVNVSIVASYGGFVGYIGKNFFTSEQGNVLGVGDTK